MNEKKFLPLWRKQDTTILTIILRGKMPEWSIGAVSKTVVPLREPRVRIPVFPRKKLQVTDLQLFCMKDWGENLRVSNRKAHAKQESLSFRRKKSCKSMTCGFFFAAYIR